MTTLEDVFLKINQEFAPELFGFDDKDGSNSGSEVENNPNTSGAAKGYSIGHSTFNTSADTTGGVLKEEQTRESF